MGLSSSTLKPVSFSKSPTGIGSAFSAGGKKPLSSYFLNSSSPLSRAPILDLAVSIGYSSSSYSYKNNRPTVYKTSETITAILYSCYKLFLSKTADINIVRYKMTLKCRKYP